MHRFKLKEVSEYHGERQYEVLAIITKKSGPYGVKVGNKLDLDTVGQIVANGHKVEIAPKNPNVVKA